MSVTEFNKKFEAKIDADNNKTILITNTQMPYIIYTKN